MIVDYAEYMKIKEANGMAARDKDFVRTEVAEALKEDVGHLRSDFDGLRSEMNVKIDQLTAGHADLSAKIDQLTAGHADLSAKIDQLTAGHADLNTKVDRLTVGYADLNAKMDRLIAAEHERQAVRKHPLIKLAYGVISFAGVAFVGYVGWIGTQVYDLNRQMGEVKTQLAGVVAEVDKLTERMDNLPFDDEFISAIAKEVDGINSDEGYNLQSIGDTALSIEQNYGGGYRSLSPLGIGDGDKEFAQDRDGVQYSPGELINTRILLSYEENGQEIFFYGQYNEQYHWDDFCVINVYKDGSLSFVMEADYEDGEVRRYRQAFPYTTSGGKEVWTVSERNNEGDKNTGESWNYYGSDVFRKSFETSHIEVKDIIYIDAVKTWLKPELESYYRGDTSNGVYNDDSGDACVVKYDEDGYIRTLYVGRIKNGDFEDDQNGGSWEIARDPEKDTDYRYFRGAFSGGRAQEDKKEESEESISQDRIDELVAGIEFGCPMTWYQGEGANN